MKQYIVFVFLVCLFLITHSIKVSAKSCYSLERPSEYGSMDIGTLPCMKKVQGLGFDYSPMEQINSFTVPQAAIVEVHYSVYDVGLDEIHHISMINQATGQTYYAELENVKTGYNTKGVRRFHLDQGRYALTTWTLSEESIMCTIAFKLLCAYQPGYIYPDLDDLDVNHGTVWSTYDGTVSYQYTNGYVPLKGVVKNSITLSSQSNLVLTYKLANSGNIQQIKRYPLMKGNSVTEARFFYSENSQTLRLVYTNLVPGTYSFDTEFLSLMYVDLNIQVNQATVNEIQSFTKSKPFYLERHDFRELYEIYTFSVPERSKIKCSVVLAEHFEDCWVAPLIDSQGNIYNTNDVLFGSSFDFYYDLKPGTYFFMTDGFPSDSKISFSTSYVDSNEIPISLSSKENYIYSCIYSHDQSIEDSQTIQYFDGFGRPIETVQKGVTPNKQDLVSIQEYDEFGRESNVWLPTPVSSYGAFTPLSTVQTAAKIYYANTYPYSKPVYEASPLNRVFEQFGPGDTWHNNKKAIRSAYLVNNTSIDTLNCFYYYVNAADNLQKQGSYRNGQLYVTSISDEDGNRVYEFKDKLGQVVLSRQMNGNIRHDTYYVYDDFGNQRFVIPPMASDQLIQDKEFLLSDKIIKNYCYVYRYDYRSRKVMKKLPGCDSISMVYDKADRLILSQDGVQRVKNEWTFNKYDAFGRIVLSGIYTDSVSHQTLRERYREVVIKEEPPYGNFGYSWNHPPVVNPENVLLVNYYDDYEHLLNQESYFRSILNYEAKEGYGEQYINRDCPTCSAKGLLVGTRVKMLDGSGELVTAMYYDDKGRIVQQKSTNQIGGYDYTYHQYGFTGNILQTMKEHYRKDRNTPTTERYAYSYDHANRLLNTIYQINQKEPVLLSSNTYDELGRLVKKERHNQEDTEVFEYNIRNWTTGIKSGDFEQKLYYNVDIPATTTAHYNGNIAASLWTYNGTSKRYRYDYDSLNRLTYACLIGDTHFEEAFYYDKQGNITQLWRSDKTGSWLDALSMRYDGNQLKNVTDEYGNQNKYGVKEYRISTPAWEQDRKKDLFFYDANGNLISDADREIVTIRYNFLNLPDTVQFRNGNQIINHYAADGRKLCTRYFTLNYPVVVPMGETREWQFEDMVVDEAITYYVDNYEYALYRDPDPSTRTDVLTLTRLHNTEGYSSAITPLNRNAQPIYSYYRRDHLGNNREVWQAQVEYGNRVTPSSTIQRTQYYPSGLPFESFAGDNPERQPYKYNSKEFVTMHGYDMYDYGARGYYPAIMRFTTVDPLAEKYYPVSPYVYCGNNPVKFVDPDGKQFLIPFLGLTNPVLPASNTPLLGVADIVKAGVEAGTKSGVTRTAAEVGKIEGHHIIPRSLKGHEVVKAARDGGFKLDGKSNKMPVEKFSKTTGGGRHSKHPKYTRQIEKKLDNFKKENPNYTPKEAANNAENITSQAKSDIKNNPDVKVNDLQLKSITLPTDNTRVVIPQLTYKKINND